MIWCLGIDVARVCLLSGTMHAKAGTVLDVCVAGNRLRSRGCLFLWGWDVGNMVHIFTAATSFNCDVSSSGVLDLFFFLLSSRFLRIISVDWGA